jgi:hypothetical protein
MDFKERLNKIKERLYRNLEGCPLGDEDTMNAAEMAQAIKLLEVNGVLVEPIEPGDPSRYTGPVTEDEDPGLPEFDTPPDRLN